MEDFYPMPMFVNLEVSDLDSSADWYQKALGFRVVYRGPNLIHLRRDRYQDLLLYPHQSEELDNPGEGIVIQFQAGDTSVGEITENAQQAGALDVEGPVEQPWNVREVTIRDPDGYQIRFSEPIDTNLSFDEVMGNN
jgi:catechol 2,3-dioxygenase-like lactoylglutathione lyase family enzyme